jgi:predicted permease
MILIGLGAVLCVLLVSCVNVANLMLARAVSRETETGIRVALGAGQSEIVRGVLVEGLILAAVGAALGMALAFWSLGLVSRLTPASVTGGDPLTVDWRVLALTIAATVISGLVCAALPALRASRVDARDALAAGARSLAASPRRAMNVLVAVEVALAFVLLFGAGLLARSFAGLDRMSPGFRIDDLLLAEVSIGFLESSPYQQPARRRDFFMRLEAALDEVSAIRSIGLAALPPGGFSPNGGMLVDGRAQPERDIHFRLVGGDYFSVLQIPIRRGRAFTDFDAAEQPQVAVVNEELVRRVFPDVDPIGQRISMNGMDGGTGVATIVGVVGDVRHRGPALPAVPEAYFSYRQRPRRTHSMTLIVDSSLSVADAASLIRDRVRAIDPLLPPEFSTMAERMAVYVEPARYRASLIGSLAGLALALAIVGITGVVSYGVARRQHEIGIRVALGATPGAISRLVVRGGMMPVAIGGLVGTLAALGLARSLSTFLYEVDTADPFTLFAVGAALLLAGAVASYVPARRAARLTPQETLRPSR